MLLVLNTYVAEALDFKKNRGVTGSLIEGSCFGGCKGNAALTDIEYGTPDVFPTVCP